MEPEKPTYYYASLIIKNRFLKINERDSPFLTVVSKLLSFQKYHFVDFTGTAFVWSDTVHVTLVP